MQSYIILHRYSPGRLPLLPHLASLSSQHLYSCLAGHPLAQMPPVWNFSWMQAAKREEVLDNHLFWADMHQRLGKPVSLPCYENHPVLFPQSWALKPQTTLWQRGERKDTMLSWSQVSLETIGIVQLIQPPAHISAPYDSSEEKTADCDKLQEKQQELAQLTEVTLLLHHRAGIDFSLNMQLWLTTGRMRMPLPQNAN